MNDGAQILPEKRRKKKIQVIDVKDKNALNLQSPNTKPDGYGITFILWSIVLHTICKP